LKDIKDVGALSQSYIDAQSTMGASIRIPGQDAGADALTAFHAKLAEKVPGLIPMPDSENAEQMTALYKRMGRPDEAIGYEHPEGVDATQMHDFATLSHGLGLTKTQYKGIMEAVQGFTAKQIEENVETLNAGTRALKQEWGIVYEDNIKFVDSVMKLTSAPASMMEMAASGNLPAEATKWLYDIGKQLGTEGINFNKDESTTRLAPSEAASRSAEIMADRKGPYWDASHPQHREFVNRVVDLNRAAAAGGR
jgi:hypothetical protein